MSSGLIAKTAAKLLVPFVIIFGFYVVMHGHLSPGGGFQGGAVAATAIALIVVAYAVHDGEELLPSLKNIKLFESAGLILFICTALAAIACGGGFLVNWFAGTGGLFGNVLAAGSPVADLWTGGMIPVLKLCNRH
jgi:Multisubunit Na+/H+ antiporter, MnhB subunit